MTELVIFVVTLLAVGILVSPIVARLPSPAWYQRARERGRPGVPVVAVGGTLALMGVLWLIGDRRGLFGVVVQLLWLGAPLTTFFVIKTWLADRRQRRTHRGQ